MHNPGAPSDVNSTTMFVNLICSKYGQLRGNEVLGPVNKLSAKQGEGSSTLYQTSRHSVVR